MKVFVNPVHLVNPVYTGLILLSYLRITFPSFNIKITINFK
jgi:hypothetical protein